MRKYGTFFALLASTAIRSVYDTGQPGWKLDENGAIVVKDGNPVYVNAQGQEMTLGTDTVGRLNGEAKGFRERAEAAEAKLKVFDGLDPEKARAALTLAEKVDQNALIDAGKVDEVKAQITAHYEGQLSELKGQLDQTTGQLNSTLLGTAFKSSDWINKNIAVPADMLQATFKDHFKVENGSIVAVGPDGKQIYSRTRMGEIANFDEAIEILVDGYSHKDRILAAPNKGGSGSGGQGGNQGGGSRLKRGDFDALAPAEKAAAAAKVRSGEVQIID